MLEFFVEVLSARQPTLYHTQCLIISSRTGSSSSMNDIWQAEHRRLWLLYRRL